VVSVGRSPNDDTPQLVAALEALGGKAALVFRCQQGRTDAYVTLQAYVGAAQPLPVNYKVNDGQEITTRWLPAKDGNALFVPTPTLAVEFIRSLPSEATPDIDDSRFRRPWRNFEIQTRSPTKLTLFDENRSFSTG
jgi:hypothetical protein